MLKIHRTIVNQIIEAARKDAPIETCGYLAETDGLVSHIFPLKNADASPEHFSFIPEEQFAMIRQVRALKAKLRVIYHSHPATPARPSEEDIRLANDPNLSYVIVSLAQKEPDIKSFLIRHGQVTPESIEIVEN
jgi:[CysO sulfur-carrier protein]-S-L-cysteine hydrolase